MRGELEHPAYGRLRAVSSVAAVLLENNPSSMTLEGTNSWLLRAAPEEPCVVVDPGHHDPEHLEAIGEAAGRVAAILVTHHHPDHVEGADRLAELVGAPVRAFDPQLCRAAPALADGESFHLAGLDIAVLHTPGHTADSVTFVVEHPERTHVLTGDTILGQGTTVLSDLGDYLDSLRKLAELPAGALGLPGHGAELADLRATVRAYLAHREQRLDQVRGALRELGRDADARRVVEFVYADVDPALWGAAEMSVRAQLDYLRQRGE
ncbi:MBL fold metallo-hydrolase [Haloechinothrix aidingensis]